MRSIKFRAWSNRDKCWCGAFSVHKSGLFTEMSGARMENGTCVAYSDWIDLSKQEEIVLMQYTGLKDKNGKEIYEGDVVVYTRHDKTIEAVVEWDNGCYYLRNHKDPVDSDTMNKDSMFFIGAERMEVIGNIYENPDLIKS